MRPVLWLALLLAGSLAGGGGCGNYSNEDLEFMNALPDDGLAANLPARSSAVSDAEEAELAHNTHQVTQVFNGLVDGIGALVDGVRSVSPSSRRPNSRTWGPFPAERHPGWLVRMIMTRDQTTSPARFGYVIAFHLAGGADTDWPALLTGSFQAGESARRGRGSFAITTAALRAEGMDPGFGMLDHLEVDYQTAIAPVVVDMHITNLPDPTMPAAAMQAAYQYRATAEGQGQMGFDLWGNFVAGPAIEKVTVTSQWLGTGEGRAALDVVEGDGAGLMQVECWDAQFRATYNKKPWSPAEELLTDPSLCPAIPLL